ncbi:RHS repeat domain-containing protein [Methylomonas sp. MED-D]|uniref:RHS repeat domain-containing protein n=1 Tax=unclassified Methylomonas TaxID=2608980 RepID=UPI0028A36AF3|nr:RHS repeat-associated core domain-containing protein [Methylomonas sp. MV1]MDT4331882.1 RHS repeat-associated core domain-containing protein [Methylomonas sp. MV1]
MAIGVDAAGNITSDGAYSYQYNRRGLLYRVYQSGAAVANYSYNALGQRTLKTLSGGKTVYQYGPGGQLLAEIGKDAQGNWLALDYVWRGERPVARFKTQVTAAGAASTLESLILHTDALGSPSDASNSQGNVVWRWTHEAFGATAPNQDPDGNGQITQLNLRFPGQYYDAETGLHYNMHRYYQPKTGRYISSDPIGVLGGINTYTYALNNPLRWTDPLGLYSKTGCNDAQCELIDKAVANAQDAANKQGIGPGFSQALETANFICKKPEKNKNYCGANNDPDIYLRNAFNPGKCGSLPSTLLHEVSHSKPLNYTEMDAYILEYKAYGTSMPTPAKLQKDYPNLSPEQIQYYSKQREEALKQ